jgi:hypothetical protein
MIDRIDYELLAFKDDLKSSKVKFDIFNNDWTSKLANWQKWILSVISAAITAAIGLASFITTITNILLPISLIGIFAASATFIFLLAGDHLEVIC